MRQIKFRAWDNFNNEMYYPDGNGYFFDKFSQEDFVIDGNGKPIYLCDMSTPTKVELMQYTGLKDKNGQEIYEGDIVKTYEEYEDEDTFDEKIHKVVWGGEDYPAFTLKPGLGTEMNVFSYLQLAADYNEVIEVVGNIYENEDIL